MKCRENYLNENPDLLNKKVFHFEGAEKRRTFMCVCVPKDDEDHTRKVSFGPIRREKKS